VRILLTGALAWNPERIRALAARGHELLGLWARSMTWDQGPYPSLDGCVRNVAIDELDGVLAERPIDCVYALFQVYEAELWGPAAAGVDHDVWTLLRELTARRARGAFDAPIVFHYGFDVHELDTEVVAVLDGHIFCNEEQRTHWTAPEADGGRGLAHLFPAERVLGWLDSDRPPAEFMGDDLVEPLSATTGELHTACIGRPLGIDFAAVARTGIHLHVYGNNFDDVEAMLVRRAGVGVLSRDVRRLREHLHLHPTRQLIGASWVDVEQEKSGWVREFSRYDAGWSYISKPFPWPPLEDASAIPNRLGTYLLAGLPVITDDGPGVYRYDELARLGTAIPFAPGDYAGLRRRLEQEVATRAGRTNALAHRHGYAFDATIDPLLEMLERARSAYATRPGAIRRPVLAPRRIELRRVTGQPDGPRPEEPPPSTVRAAATTTGARARQLLGRARPAASRARRLGRVVRARARTRVLRRRLHLGEPTRRGEPTVDRDRSRRIATVERFVEPSRRCGPELLDGADALVLDLRAHEPSRLDYGIAALRWLVMPVGPRRRLRLARACLQTGGGPRKPGLAAVPGWVRALRNADVAEVACFSERDFPLPRALAEATGLPFRALLESSTQYLGEFAYEMFAVIPYAHWLHQQGRLEHTVSTADTRCLYPFSPHHVERDEPRRYVSVTEWPAAESGGERGYNFHGGMPTVLDTTRWAAPPYRELYGDDDRFRWPKPAVAICNKASDERYLDSGFAVNHLDVDLLLEVVGCLVDRYTVIYDRPRAVDIVNDHAEVREPGDLEALRTSFPEVVTIQDLHAAHPDLTFNELQLRVLASCESFVSVLGGGAYLASYFGGTNIVYACRGFEVDTDAYRSWFHHFSGTRMVPVDSPAALLDALERELLA
jgi:hypothetical protein